MLISISTTIGKSTHDWPKVLAGSGVEDGADLGGIGRRPIRCGDLKSSLDGDLDTDLEKELQRGRGGLVRGGNLLLQRGGWSSFSATAVCGRRSAGPGRCGVDGSYPSAHRRCRMRATGSERRLRLLFSATAG
jgi:hypothetical protein